MTNRDEKMRERFLQREDDRLQKKLDKKLRKAKEAFYSGTHKDREADEVYQHLLNLRAQMEDRR